MSMSRYQTHITSWEPSFLSWLNTIMQLIISTQQCKASCMGTELMPIHMISKYSRRILLQGIGTNTIHLKCLSTSP